MQLIRDAIPSPLNLINEYLGVTVDGEFKYICPHIREDNCWITVDNNPNLQTKQIVVLKKTIELLKRKSPLCPLIFQTSISKSDAGLKLCTGKFEKSEEEKEAEINPNDGFLLMVASDDAAIKAEVLTSIFYDRIKPHVLGDANSESLHRVLFAWALESHVAMHFKPEVQKELQNPIESAPLIDVKKSEKTIEIKDTRSSFEKQDLKPRRSSTPNTKPSLKMTGSPLEQSDGKTKKPSSFAGRFNLHLSSLDLPNSASTSPRSGELKVSPSQKQSSEKDVMKDALLKLVSLSSLYNCRCLWIDFHNEHKKKHHSHKQHINDMLWDPGELSLLNKLDMLSSPRMHQLVQYELSKDIAFELNTHVLMQDIHRTLDYIDKDYHGRTKVCLRDNILDTKSLGFKNDGLSVFNAEVSCFYYILERLLLALGPNQSEQRRVLLNQWKECANKELNELCKQWKKYAVEECKRRCSQSEEFTDEELMNLRKESKEFATKKVNKLCNQSFVTVGEEFFKGIERDIPFNKKVVALIILLRQRFYNHPFSVVHEVTADVPLTFKKEDPKRLIQFDFKDGNVEFRTTLNATPSIEPEKWGKNVKPFSGCEIELVSIMRSNDNQFSSWQSRIEINLKVFKNLQNKNAHEIPIRIKQQILDPLTWVGFVVDVEFVENSFTSSF